MGDTSQFFTRAIEVMAVYSLMITLLIYSLPTDSLTYVYELKSSPAYRETSDISSQFQSNIDQQRSFGVVERAALALYSGNILIDLLLNFFTAVPSMATIIMKGILIFMNLSDPLENALMSFTYAIVGIIYILSIILLLLDIRSGSGSRGT